MPSRQKIAVGLSGGVDSAVAAALLARAGREVMGLTMLIWPRGGAPRLEAKTGAKQACFGPGEEEDVAACESLCAKLGIPYRVVDLSAEYEERVLGYFRREYRSGRTPNPCVVCNRELKFGFLAERARELGYELFATGHYARIAQREGVALLRAAAQEAKDQSYFLYRLGPEILSRVLFPLGELSKDEVRAAARELGLEVADKPESQDFVAGGDYAPLFADAPPESGDFVDREGRLLGRHRGLPFYTIGQRRGLGLSLGPDPLYVLELDAARNRVVLGPGEGLFAESLVAEDFELRAPWLAGGPFRARAKIRQNARAAPCAVTLGAAAPSAAATGAAPTGAAPLGPGEARIDFDEPQRAVAPGQSAVLYDDDGLVLGGGIICRR